MGIKGTIFALPPKNRLENMKVGDEAYMEAYHLTVTKRAVFIDRISEILTEEEYKEPDGGYDGLCVAIKRVGPGFTEDDFEIDASILIDYDFNLEDNGTFAATMEEKELYLVFDSKSFELEVIEKVRKPLLFLQEAAESEQQLRIRLQDAIDKEDFETASVLKAKIDNLQKGQ